MTAAEKAVRRIARAERKIRRAGVIAKMARNYRPEAVSNRTTEKGAAK